MERLSTNERIAVVVGVVVVFLAFTMLGVFYNAPAVSDSQNFIPVDVSE